MLGNMFYIFIYFIVFNVNYINLFCIEKLWILLYIYYLNDFLVLSFLVGFIKYCEFKGI